MFGYLKTRTQEATRALEDNQNKKMIADSQKSASKIIDDIIGEENNEGLKMVEESDTEDESSDDEDIKAKDKGFGLSVINTDSTEQRKSNTN